MTPVSKLEDRGEVGFGFTRCIKTCNIWLVWNILAFRVNCNKSKTIKINDTEFVVTNHEQTQPTETPALGHRTECREQGASGLPLGTSLRCPALLNSPAFRCEFFEHSKPVVRLLKWPHKRGSTCNHEWLKHIVYIYIYLHVLFTDSYDASCFRVTPNQWHVRFKSSWRQMQSKPTAQTQASLCQNLPHGPRSLPPRSYLLWISNLILGMIQKLSFTGCVHI